LKLDIACGQVKQDGWVGIDLCALAGVDLVHDLNEVPWPIDSGAADEARCSHYFEHVPRLLRPRFMSEVWRVLAPGGKILLQTPLGLHRQFQDFSHAWPVFPESYQYFDRNWLTANRLDHYIAMYQINCNFRIADVLISATDQFRSDDVEQTRFAAEQYIRGGSDLVVLLEKQPL
jgi:predicted SAM-dependent methyltransferase